MAAHWQYTTNAVTNSRPARQFDTPLQVRVTSEQRDLFERAARKDERSLSNWVRDRLVKTARKELK